MINLSFSKDRYSVFYAVGTKGVIKGICAEEMAQEPINCQILLGNTYHLGNDPGTEILEKFGGLHKYMKWNRNILTDSGGFQMVSLLALAEITEQGVNFQSPKDGTMMMLTPEESIRTQHKIGSDIVMMLDDVVHSCTIDDARFKEATDRTVRWLDRCIAEHERGGKEDYQKRSGSQFQNLFAIVQGGLDVSPGGLREHCLNEFVKRDSKIPGYAIGGLAGGEEKDAFWRVVDLCCRRLPPNKPRYLMGVGYPLDLVVCSALGVDMYDCVYPTRTARFGTVFTPNGTIRLKKSVYAKDFGPIYEGCKCNVCNPIDDMGTPAMSRSSLHFQLLLRESSSSVLTHHNIVYMLQLSRDMRRAIIENAYPTFVRKFLTDQFIHNEENIPEWVQDALFAAGIDVSDMIIRNS